MLEKAIKMGQENIVLAFDDTSKKRVLQSLGIHQNDKSELVDENDKILTSQDFESIKFDEFGGILQGSKQAIKKNKIELVRYFIGKQK